MPCVTANTHICNDNLEKCTVKSRPLMVESRPLMVVPPPSSISIEASSPPTSLRRFPLLPTMVSKILFIVSAYVELTFQLAVNLSCMTHRISP